MHAVTPEPLFRLVVIIEKSMEIVQWSKNNFRFFFLKLHHYLGGKSAYKRQRLELTIPNKYKDSVEPFLCKDLKVEAGQEGNNLVIETKPLEKLSKDI